MIMDASDRTSGRMLPGLDGHDAAAAPPHIVERNRRNAQRSTGPRTIAGKQRLRRNSLKHGLCANPAAGVVEDRQQFRALHEELVTRLEPRDPIEAGLVHRIAVSLWRLQRAARADAAATELAVRSVVPQREHVQRWIEDIQGAWRVEVVAQVDPELLRQQREEGHPSPDGRRWRVLRPRLRCLDRWREQEIMRSAAAITAMEVMLSDLTDRLRRDPRFVSEVEAEQVAWLLGESAERLPIDYDEVQYPDERPHPRPTDLMIGEARRRQPDEPLPPAFVALVEGRKATLRQQRELCEQDLGGEAEHHRRVAALLPDAAILDRFIRYETHADRSLQQALQALARLRGIALGTVVTAISARAKDGGEVHVQQMIPWESNGSGFCETNPDGAGATP